MEFSVRLTEDAEQDLDDIHAFIRIHDSLASADRVIDRIGRAFASLDENPHRGPHPPEMLALSERDFREIFFKPYRIVYHVREREVVVILIADGRRDMRTLLQRRLLGVPPEPIRP